MARAKQLTHTNTFLAVMLTGFVLGTGTGPAQAQFQCPPDYWVCVPDKMYHPVRKIDGQYKNAKGGDAVEPISMYINGHGRNAQNPLREKPHHRARETQFHRAFMEFNERGFAFAADQKAAILAKIDELKNADRPLYVVTYVHGWHHNARTDFPNTPSALRNDGVKIDYLMARYAEHTRRLFELNRVDQVPTMLAIFVGWRGEELDVTKYPLGGTGTLGTRARAADRLAENTGKGSLRQALEEIAAKVHATGPDARFVLLGHSLGGRIVSRMFIPQIAAGNKQPLGPRSLIVALQPAIDATCFDSVFESGVKGDPAMMPSFLSITSRDDKALREYYKAARFLRVGNLIGWSISPPACKEWFTQGRDKITIGFYDDYLTHRLDYETFEGDRGVFKPDGTPRIPPIETQPAWLFKEGSVLVRYPYFNVKDKYCPQHSNRPCYNHKSVLYGAFTLKRRNAYAKAGPVWNIITDKSLVDVSDLATHSKPGTTDSYHNAIASSDMTAFIVRMTYTSKTDWPETEQKPKTPDNLPVVREPEPKPKPSASATN